MSTNTARPRTLRVAIIGTLAVAALVGGLAWWARPKPVDGLIVEVRVTDPTGAPVSSAEIARRFAPGWEPTDSQGRLRLTNLLLRAGERASEEAIAGAIDVKAAYHAVRPGSPPVVERSEAGGWQARFVLEPFGLFRLHLRPNKLPNARAWVVPPPRGKIEAVDGVECARTSQPASWRVFGDVMTLEIRTEGAAGVAARRRTVDAPAPGFLREMRVVAEKALPIRGRIRARGGITPPTLTGRMEVTEVAQDGKITVHAPVWIDDDGLFSVPYAGEGRYRLRPRLGYLDTPPQVVRGGQDVDFLNARVRPWLRLDLSRPEAPEERSPRIRLLLLPEHVAVRGLVGQRYEEGRWNIPLPGPGRYRVELDLIGTKALRPATGAVDVEVDGTPGPHEVTVTLQEAPAGTVRVRVAKPEAPDEAKRGADVELMHHDRRATILFGVGQEAHFANVLAGPVDVHVNFGAPQIASFFGHGELTADGELVVEATADAGGTLEGLARGPNVADGKEARVVSWEAGLSPYGEAPGEVLLGRTGDLPVWQASEALRPGTYHATIRVQGGRSSAGQPVVFEIRPGERTRFDFRVEGSR